jgi:hypothetical protein
VQKSGADDLRTIIASEQAGRFKSVEASKAIALKERKGEIKPKEN